MSNTIDAALGVIPFRFFRIVLYAPIQTDPQDEPNRIKIKEYQNHEHSH